MPFSNTFLMSHFCIPLLVHAKFPTFPLDIDLNIPYKEASMVDSNEGFLATQHDSNHGGKKENLLTKGTGNISH